jgi:TonB family protein
LWVACTRLREESERACDDVVMSRGVEGPEYAAQLLDLARALNAQRHLWLAAPAMARASSLERRVAAMLNARINRNPIARSARVVTFAALVALALAVAGFNASAQATFASFSGSVVDQLGGTVPGATLTVSNNQTGQKYQVRSNAVGSFEFVGLTAGEYELRTELPGFRAANGRFTVAGRNVRQDIALRVASIQETITVVDRGEPRADASQARVRRGPAPKGAPCVAVPAGGHIAPPTKTVDVKPIYPRNLEGAKVDGGVVVLDALIGTDGSIQDVRPVDPAVQPELASAAMEAVRLWRFTPTLLNCVPIEVSMNVTVNFKAE